MNKPTAGFEPATLRLKVSCSTAELSGHRLMGGFKIDIQM